MRVLVCGGRDYKDQQFLWDALDALHKTIPHDCMTIIQGGARGADQLAREWCFSREVAYDNYPADWKTHGPAAGPIRNQRMLDAGKPDLVVAFPGGKGTADMVERAKRSGIIVFRYSSPPATGKPENEGA